MSHFSSWSMLLLASLAAPAAAAPDVAGAEAPPLLFKDDDALAAARAALLTRQDARGLATSPLSAKELRLRLGEPAPAPTDASARMHLTWHPYFAAWSALPERTADNTLWFDAIPPMGQIGVRMSDGDVFAADLQVDLSPVRHKFTGTSTYSPWTLESWVNLDFPRRSWAAATTDHFTFALGRFKTGIGHGVFGNTFLNGRAPWYDQAQATFFTDWFRAFWLVGTSSSFMFGEEAALQSFGAEGPPTAGFDPLNNYDGSRFDAPAKTFMVRRFELAPFPWLVFGIGELGVVGGKWPDLSQLLPMVAWHNAYAPGSTNVMMEVDAALSPWPGVLVFGELSVDDIATPYEDDNAKPTALAWQLGAQWTTPLGARHSLELAAEFTHVDPWTYARWQPYLVMQQRQILPCGCLAVDVPLGYPWGGDLDTLGAQLTLTDHQGMRVVASVEQMWRGPVRLGALTDTVLVDETGAPRTDRYGTSIRAPLYYDLDLYAGEGALERFFAAHPTEQRTTVATRVELPVAPHLRVLGQVHLAWLDNADNVAGAQALRALLHAGALVDF